MKENALYFMPDISGFTDFVTSTEIEHSKHIISELLEILIDANYINLKLVEIEGDALFMYTTEFPEFSELIEQSKQMLNAFAEHVNLYNTGRICECGACFAAQGLQVKFLIHYGAISYMRVKDIVKPYGADVIKIHRLLKNSIPSDQYLLISKDTLDYYRIEQKDISGFTINEDKYDYGISKYAYTNLESYTANKRKPTVLSIKPNREPEIFLKVETPGDVNDAINYISSLKHRSEWYQLVDRLEFDDLRVNRAGTVHQCIVGTNVFNVESLKWNLESDEKGYGERTSDMPNIDEYQYYITLKQNGKVIEIKIEVFIDFQTDLKDTENQLMEIMNAWNKSQEVLRTKINNLSH